MGSSEQGSIEPSSVRLDHALSVIRAREEQGWFHDDAKRGAERYQTALKGYGAFLSHVQHSVSNGTILDLGAGNALAINEIAKGESGNGLHFKATGLVRPADYDQPVPYFETSGEVLDGIEDNSIGGIMAVYSTTYSPEPSMTTDAIDRVLVPGGVIKATHKAIYRPGDLHFVKADRYASLFEGKGYDVALDGKLVVAIKPGGESSMSSQVLMEKDRATLPK